MASLVCSPESFGNGIWLAAAAPAAAFNAFVSNEKSNTVSADRSTLRIKWWTIAKTIKRFGQRPVAASNSPGMASSCCVAVGDDDKIRR